MMITWANRNVSFPDFYGIPDLFIIINSEKFLIFVPMSMHRRNILISYCNFNMCVTDLLAVLIFH